MPHRSQRQTSPRCSFHLLNLCDHLLILSDHLLNLSAHLLTLSGHLLQWERVPPCIEKMEHGR